MSISDCDSQEGSRTGSRKSSKIGQFVKIKKFSVIPDKVIENSEDHEQTPFPVIGSKRKNEGNWRRVKMPEIVISD